MTNNWKQVINYILLVGLVFVSLYGTFWLLQITTYCSFHAPTDSMVPTILPGDYGIINKWKMGARIFNVFDAMEGKKVKIYRLPGYGQVERNDIAVFNYPLLGKDTVGMNMRTYYCKRIVALPGDTLEIRNCRYQVRGSDDLLGYLPTQVALDDWINRLDDPQEYICYISWPYDSVLNWTIRDFGPLFIPSKGSKIALTRENTLIYGRYIAWEQQTSCPEWRDGRAWIDNKPLDSYTFEEDYYFTAGDRAENSADSRYWGLLPEPMIVGVSNFLWYSQDHDTGDIRWDRIFTQFNPQ